MGMSESVFITGATGFIGRALIRRLVAAGTYNITALARHVPELQPNEANWVVGDLLDSRTYQSSLRRVDTVIHLAARTGKASPHEHELINVEGTRKLLEAAKAAGVQRFVHMSTIAVTFPDQRWYPYAQTKKRAEALVRDSDIPSIILRPTIVLGEDSPIWRLLTRVANRHIILMPNGGRVLVQPILVTDLVYGIEQALSRRQFQGETLDLGGPSPLAFAEFVRVIHRCLRGKQPRLFPIPLLPFRAALGLLEPLARPVLPITAGQLAVFANDSSVTPNWLHDTLKGRMRSLEEAIDSVVVGASGQEFGATKEIVPFKSSSAPADELAHTGMEHAVFTRYLTSEAPTEYVGKQYRMALAARGLAKEDGFSAFDRVTLDLARRGPLCTRLADAYCAMFRRHGALRRKLILLMAIVEHTASYSERFDRPISRSAVGSAAFLFVQGVQFILSLMVGAVLLLPAHLLSLYRSSRESRGGSQ
jgi:nucleoside-diphosphate-sugar epimerase